MSRFQRVLAVTFAISSVVSGTVEAQESAGTTTANANVASELESVVVSASRIVRDGFTAPTPVTVLSVSDLTLATGGTLAGAVNALPALAGSMRPTNSETRLRTGDAGANFLSLRNLGAPRTLTLLDGRRVVASSLTGAVDVNLIPTPLIQRVEVVTGGASAAWGSDAVAGVVNFVTDTKFTGFKGEVRGGTTSEGDNDSIAAEFAVGIPFADSRGHFLASGSYYDAGAVLAGDRDWMKGCGVVNNPAFSAGSDEARRIYTCDIQRSLMAHGGLITAGPMRGTRFGPGGAPGAFEFGQVMGSIMIGGDSHSFAKYTQLTPSLENLAFFSRASFSMSDAVTVYAEGSYGESTADQLSSFYFREGNIPIQADNAFLHPDVVSRMGDLGITSFTMGVADAGNNGHVKALNERSLLRGLAGLDAKLGETWSLNAYYQYGKSEFDNVLSNDPIVANFNRAIDAVRDPGTDQVVCRSTLTDPSNGCVPLNIFGDAVASPQAVGYYTGVSRGEVDLTQHVVSATLNGEVWSNISLAVGIEYRRDEAEGIADELSIQNAFFLGNYKPFTAPAVEVQEAFAEVAVPILKDLPGAYELELNGAFRYTDYSTFGGVRTWKVGVGYMPTRELRLRLTRSRDIRAPSLYELYTGAVTNPGTIQDPVLGTTYTINSVLSGNDNLQPEIANTLVAGLVYQPDWLPGFTTSIDYYDIDIDDAVETPVIQQIINRCAAGEAALCDQITRSGTGVITQVISAPLNAQTVSTSGIDWELSYQYPLANLGGKLSFRSLLSYADSLKVTSANQSLELVGQTTGGTAAEALPEYQWNGNLSYTQGPMYGGIVVRHISSMVFDNNWGPLDIDNADVPSRTYVDLNAAYSLGGNDKLRLFGAIENVFDKDPPRAYTTSQFFPIGAIPLHDRLGRTFRAGLRVTF